jgi:chorismate synthase
MLTRLRMLTAGESHGPLLTAILDGMPAGLTLPASAIDEQLARRQRGYGSGGRMRIETDRVEITGGVMAGRTTGGPLSLLIRNLDWENWRGRDIDPMTKPRPGHADLTGAIKYGHRDLRLSLERASARETAARVAAGAACRALLSELGIRIGGYAVRIGSVALDAPVSVEDGPYLARFAAALESDVACPDPELDDGMRREIGQCRTAGDTLGGVLEVVALGLPPGLGSFAQWDRRLDGRIAGAMLSIQAMKGAEIGPAFANSAERGGAVQDEIHRGADGALVRLTNRAGGLEGGVTTGAPLVVRVAMKPLSTTLDPRRTVDLATGDGAETTYERSDFCALPRAVPVAEAMLALVLADALLEKVGGDSLDEIRPRFDALRRARLADLPMDDAPWRFGPPSGGDDDRVERGTAGPEPST